MVPYQILKNDGEDFNHLAEKSKQAGIIHVSHYLLTEQIDIKITALLLKSTPMPSFAYLPSSPERRKSNLF